MIEKGTAKNILAPAYLFAIDLVRQWTAKTMIGGTKRDERFARVNIVYNLFQFGLWQRQQASEEDHQVRRSKMFQARNVVVFKRSLFSFLGINRQCWIDVAFVIHSE